MSLLNQTNIKKVNECRSIINIIDILIDDVKNRYEYFKRSFNFTISYLLDVFNYIKFEDVKNIVKYFNLKKYDVVISFLNDLRNKCIKTVRSYY